MTTTADESLWLEAIPSERYPAPAGDLQVDVAVLGGGIAGLTTALLLARDGVRVTVVEAGRVGGGVTGNNTAKVTALQACVYSSISAKHGRRAAAAYAAGSLAAVEQVAALAGAEGIDCDLERRAACTVAMHPEEVGAVRREHAAARDAGLPVSIADSADLPYPTFAAVRLADQLVFHPVRYAQGLAAAAVRAGAVVFEGTRALSLHEGRPCRVRTDRATITAEHVVVATHFPVFDRGGYFALLEPIRSYGIAARLRGAAPQDLAINAGTPIRSVSSHRGMLVLAGESHETGARGIDRERFDRLESFAREHWDVEAVSHRWSAQDPSSYDQLPMIGPYTPVSSRLHVATGFMKWGLTSGTMAAGIIADRILGRQPTPWAQTFSPTRVTLRSLPALVSMNAKVGAEFVTDRITPGEVGSVAEVPPGQGRVLREGHRKLGVYRAEDGAVHGVSLRCTHLGCLLRFNGAERSWDCGCHGSRFDVDGAVQEGPAVHPLEREDL